MTHNTFLIVNPCSGRARIKNHLLDIVRVLSDAGHRVTVYPTKARADATSVVAALDDSFDTIVCCGGDGTLNEVISGMMKNPHSYRLGYIPAGTLNEWSGGLHISRNAVAAATDLVQEHVIPLDIGQFGEKYFTYTASFGAFTEASYAAPQEVKNAIGQAAYLFEGIKAVSNIKPVHLRLLIDGTPREGDYLFGTVSNSLSVGGVVHFDETTIRLNDGLFEVMLIGNPANLLELNDILDGLLKKDLNRKNIEFVHAKEVTVIPDLPLDWTLDGECAAGVGEITIKNIHSAVSFLVPQAAAEAQGIPDDTP